MCSHDGWMRAANLEYTRGFYHILAHGYAWNECAKGSAVMDLPAGCHRPRPHPAQQRPLGGHSEEDETGAGAQVHGTVEEQRAQPACMGGTGWTLFGLGLLHFCFVRCRVLKTG